MEELNQLESPMEQEIAVPAEPSHLSEEQQQAAAQKKADDSDRNITRLREDKKRLERERDDMYRRVQEFEAAKQRELAPDDIAEGKDLKRLEDKIERTFTELRLKAQYPDFDEVVNSETIASLRDLYPDIAAALHATPDTEAKGSSVYKIIKKMGIYREDTFKNEKEQAVNNATKPRPLTSVSPQQGESPLARANAFANGLTDELREQLRKEMYQARMKN